MKLFKKAKENKKGFTLVELIVVLVILAILIALLVPALTGYIDKARQKSIAAEARYALTACQTEATDYYDTGDAKEIKSFIAGGADTKTPAITEALAPSMAANITADKLVDGFDLSKVTYIVVDKAGKVTHLVYRSGKYVATYTNTGTDGKGTWATTKDDTI